MKEEKNIEKKYTNGDITVVWKPALCTHIAYCFTELPEVFDPSERPWINAKGANTKRIIEQVKRCPTAALTFFYNDPEKNQKTDSPEGNEVVKIEIMKDGPAIVNGKSVIILESGNETKHEGIISLCRCGKSKNQPLCDGSHCNNENL